MQSMKSSKFNNLKEGEPIEVVEMVRAFKEDPCPDKVNLSIGGYLKGLNAHLLNVVKKAEEELVADPELHHSYLPTLGYPEINAKALEFLLGKDHVALQGGRAFSVQSVGGTGPIRIAAEMLRNQLGYTTALYSHPTWLNHRDIFIKAGFDHVEPYSYEIFDDGTLDFEKVMRKLKSVPNPEKTVLMLHASAHNPTGVDPTRAQWREIKRVCHQRGILPFFDCAYQGFATGDVDTDAFAVRYFCSNGEEFGEDQTEKEDPTLPALEIFVSQSFGKNLGLYGERIGFLVGVVNDPDVIPKITSQLALEIRPMYSNPPGYGAKIVGKVLSSPELLKMWREEMKDMVRNVGMVKKNLHEMLKERVPDYDWSGIISQIGMFYDSKLSYEQGMDLMRKHHVYILPSSGRINVGAISSENIVKVADALADVVKNS